MEKEINVKGDWENQRKNNNNNFLLLTTLDMKTERDLSHMYSSIDDPKILEDRKLYGEKICAFADRRSKNLSYMQDANVLYEALKQYEELNDMYNETHYFNLLSAKYTQDKTISAKYNQAEEFAVKMANKLEFFQINIWNIEQNKQQEFLDNPILQDYKHHLERTFLAAKYVLSEKEEQIINIMHKTSNSNWQEMLESFLSKETADITMSDWKINNLPFASILWLMSWNDEEVRKQAYDITNSIFLKHRDVAEKEINSILEYKKNMDEIRGYDRPDSSRHIEDDIDTKIVDQITDSISNRFDISKKYYQFKAQLFGKYQLEYYQRSIPYWELNDDISYQEAVEIVRKAFLNLDKEFLDIFDDFLINGKIDAHPDMGKQWGAFCSYNNKSGPVYVFLNHTNTNRDVMTIAHEMWHAINFVKMKDTENSLNYGTPTSTAEVASTFMEGFALEEILKTIDSDEEKLSLMMKRMDEEISTIQRQISFYNFEKELHSEFRKIWYLSADQIWDIFQKHMQAYMGPWVKQEELTKNRWIYISHFRYFFYVYSYASGLLIAKSMQSKVRQDKIFVEEVKQYLETGHSQSPKEIFANMGIDILDKSFWDAWLDEQEKFLDEAIALAKKLGKI